MSMKNEKYLKETRTVTRSRGSPEGFVFSDVDQFPQFIFNPLLLGHNNDTGTVGSCSSRDCMRSTEVEPMLYITLVTAICFVQNTPTDHVAVENRTASKDHTTMKIMIINNKSWNKI